MIGALWGLLAPEAIAGSCDDAGSCPQGTTCQRGRCVKEQVRCVRFCEQRDAGGGCVVYGQDFCAADAVCAAQWLGRRADGRC